tara:strand:+ start:10839 stop:12041 length:1203 start_codon:yes stop_codon:yes gene_type:complete
MSGSKIILQAIGEQNTYLNKNAKHTLFKKNPRRYSAFGLDWSVINSNYKNTLDFAQPGSNHYFRIDKNGDVINEIYLRVKLLKNSEWDSSSFNIKETIFNIIRKVEFLYNDKVICKLDSDFIFSYFELNYTENQKKDLINMFSYDNVAPNAASDNVVFLTIPLPLWFHKNPGNAFPLWALYNPNVGINISIQDENTFPKGTKIIQDLEILVNFTQLTSQEKEQFANKPLEYLIEIPEQLEKINVSDNATHKKISVLKTHFVKYLFWNIKDITNKANSYHYLDDLESASITFNGNALVDNAPAKYFNQVNRYMYFNSGSRLSLLENNNQDPSYLNPIYTYSFSLNPIQSKLSGYFTTEKFNDVTFEFDIKNNPGTSREVNIYLVKHNIIRISDGYLNILYN